LPHSRKRRDGVEMKTYQLLFECGGFECFGTQVGTAEFVGALVGVTVSRWTCSLQ